LTVAAGTKLPVVTSSAPKAKPKAAGWAAFTDGGTAPRLLIAARVVLVLALGL
jgi:hypothetical protein